MSERQVEKRKKKPRRAFVSFFFSLFSLEKKTFGTKESFFNPTFATSQANMYELRGPPAPPSFGVGPSSYGAGGGGIGGGGMGGGGNAAFRGAGGGDASSFRSMGGGGDRSGGGAADAVGKVKDPILRVIAWAKSRNPREKSILGGAAALVVSFFLLDFRSKRKNETSLRFCCCFFPLAPSSLLLLLFFSSCDSQRSALSIPLRCSSCENRTKN